MRMDANKLASLLQFVTSQGRICPRPLCWDRLWKMLPEKERRAGDGNRLSPPLILSGWWYSSNADKKARLREHIEFAAKNGRLDEVDSFLRRLPLSRWHIGAGNDGLRL